MLLSCVKSISVYAARFDIDIIAKEDMKALEEAAHPWATITQMLLVDGASDQATMCICCTDSNLFMMCKIALANEMDAVEDANRVDADE